MPTTTADENKELIREYIAAGRDNDLEAMAALISDDYTCTHTLMTGEEVVIGAENFREFMGAFQDVVSVHSEEIQDLVAAGDQVMYRITWRGVHDGEFFGIEPTGNRVEGEEYGLFRIDDGEIVEQRFLMDDLQFLRQLDFELPIDG